MRASALAFALFFSLAVRAQQPAPPGTQQPAAPGAGQPAAPPDFDLFPAEKPVDAATRKKQEEVERSIRLRRSMLQLHQLGGFLTLGALTLTVVSGQLDYIDKYGGGGDTARFHALHRYSAYSAAGIFAATGLLALFAPNPTDKPLRLDTATLHKIAMSIATAAMVAEVILGPLAGSKEGTLAQRDFALAHQVVGYTALVATFAGFTVLTF